MFGFEDNLPFRKCCLVSTVWRRGSEIFIATDDKSDERLIGMGEQPWITSTKEGPIVVWCTRRGGELKMKIDSDDEVHTLATNAYDAVVTAEPVQGNNVYVFWEQTEGGRSSILAKAVKVDSLRSKN